MEQLFINLIPTGRKETCHVKQFDAGRAIRLNLFENTLAYAIQSGDRVTLTVEKPNKEAVTVALTATTGNTYVDLVTTAQMDDLAGVNKCDLTIKNGAAEIRTGDFFMEVKKAAGGDEPTGGRRGGLTASGSEIISTTYETV